MKIYKAKFKKRRTQKPVDNLRYTEKDKADLSENVLNLGLDKSLANKNFHIMAKDLAKEINITVNYIYKLNQITERKIMVVSIEDKRNIYTKIIKNTEKLKVVSMPFTKTNVIENLKSSLEKLTVNEKEKPLLLFVDILLDAKIPALNRDYTKKIAFEINLKKNNLIKDILEKDNQTVKLINYNLEKDEKKNNKDYLLKLNKKELSETDAILFGSSKKIITINKKWKTSPSENKKEVQLADFEKLLLWNLERLKK